MMQYVPVDGVYVYFRYDNNQTIMVAMNTAKDPKTIAPADYKERTHGFSKMKDIVTGDITPLLDFSLDAKASGVWELLH